MPWKWIGGALGVLVVIVILIILFSGDGSAVPEQFSTQTIPALADKPTNTPTIEPMAPTSTLPESTSASIITPNDLLKEAQTWPPILISKFNMEDGHWDIGDFGDSGETGTWSVEDGKYIWEMKAIIDDTRKGNYPAIAPSSDFYLSVDTRVIDGPRDEISYGLIFRDYNGDFYTFRIEDGPYWRVRLFLDGEWKNLTQQVLIPSTQFLDTNTLSVIADGPDIKFFINEEFVGELENTSLSHGDVGFTVTINHRNDEVLLEVDNFEFREKPK